MKDRREQILRKCDELTDGLIWNGDGDIIKFDGPIQTVYNAMDENGKQMCLELLEYMAKNKIQLDIVKGKVQCYLSNGEGITKEQLFENFL